MDLPVLAKARAGHILAADRELVVRNGGHDSLRTIADGDRPDPVLAVGDAYCDTRGAEKARSGVGDPLQRAFGISGRVGDGAEDFGAGALAIAAGAQLVPQ